MRLNSVVELYCTYRIVQGVGGSLADDAPENDEFLASGESIDLLGCETLFQKIYRLQQLAQVRDHRLYSRKLIVIECSNV
jgi:hypothetical protein